MRSLLPTWNRVYPLSTYEICTGHQFGFAIRALNVSRTTQPHDLRESAVGGNNCSLTLLTHRPPRCAHGMIPFWVYKTAPKCALLLPVARKMCPSFASDENCATNREEREGVDDHLRVIILHGALVDLHDRVFHLLMVMHHPFLHIYAATRIPVELSPHDIQTGG